MALADYFLFLLVSVMVLVDGNPRRFHLRLNRVEGLENDQGGLPETLFPDEMRTDNSHNVGRKLTNNLRQESMHVNNIQQGLISTINARQELSPMTSIPLIVWPGENIHQKRRLANNIQQDRGQTNNIQQDRRPTNIIQQDRRPTNIIQQDRRPTNIIQQESSPTENNQQEIMPTNTYNIQQGWKPANSTLHIIWPGDNHQQDPVHSLDAKTSTTTTPSGQKSGRQAGCTKLPDPGECRGAFLRFYLNPITDQCDCFFFGGCDEDEVYSWLTLDECVSACVPTNTTQGPGCHIEEVVRYTSPPETTSEKISHVVRPRAAANY